MPTWPQWEPTRLIPLKVCLRRPNARVKRRLSVRRHTSVCFWKVGNGTFAYATTVPFTFLLSGMPYGTLHSLQAARAPRLQSVHRHLAATPMCSSRTSNQVPKRTLNIWWINHDKSLESSQATCSTVASLVKGSSGRFNVLNMDWCGTWAGGQSGHPSLRGAYAKSTRSLRLFQGSPWQESGETFLLSKS